MKNKRTLVLIVTVVTITISAGLVYLKPSLTHKPVSKVSPQAFSKQSLPELAQTKASDNLAAQVDFIRTPQTQDRANFAASLEGTDIDGALISDQKGNLVLSIAVRDFFDYFLSASDEIGPEAAIDEIVRYAQEYLPAKAAKQSIEILRNYLRYKKAELELQTQPISGNDLSDENTHSLIQEYFSKLKQVRSELFNQQTDQALFALEDSYSNFTLASLKLRSDTSLETQQKEQELVKLRSELPSELSESHNKQKQIQLKQEKISVLLKSDIDDAQLYDELLAQDYSKDHAQRLIADRQKQKIFEQRYTSYQLAKNEALQALSKQGESQSQDQQSELITQPLIKQLRNTYFVNPEDRTRAALRDKQ